MTSSFAPSRNRPILLATAVALSLLVGCGSSTSKGASASSSPSTPSTSASGSAGSSCGSVVRDITDLAGVVTSSDKTKQEKVDAAKSLGSQISTDAQTAAGAIKSKLSTLSDDVSALAKDISNGAGADQIKTDVSTLASDATAVGKACFTQ